MASQQDRPPRSLVIEIDPWLRDHVESAAAAHGIPVVAHVLRTVLGEEQSPPATEQPGAWSRLSVSAFSRDWDSDADAVYDDLA